VNCVNDGLSVVPNCGAAPLCLSAGSHNEVLLQEINCGASIAW
jgi:hypothetical protein